MLETFILAPEDAPTWAQDRGQLWNEAERAEARGNGRLATELELALPHELDAAQRKELLTDLLRPLVERYGVHDEIYAAEHEDHARADGKDSFHERSRGKDAAAQAAHASDA